MNKEPTIIPVGTQVVTSVAVEKKGGKVAHPERAVAVVVRVLEGNNYRVRFLDGYEAVFARSQLTIRKHFQQVPGGEEDVDFRQFVIYRCVTGSRAYGLDEEGSDTDRRGIYLPPAQYHWSLYGIPEQLEDKDQEETYWELQKFLVLALKANPNILECLYTPLIEEATPLAQELLNQREIFLSELVYQTYNGYVMSQFRKLRRHRENHGEIRWKHAMHLIRLLLSGITILREGFVPVAVDQYRPQLLAIRHGEQSWDAVNRWRLRLHEQFDAAYASTSLPARPNYEAANDFLLRARRQMV